MSFSVCWNIAKSINIGHSKSAALPVNTKLPIMRLGFDSIVDHCAQYKCFYCIVLYYGSMSARWPAVLSVLLQVFLSSYFFSCRTISEVAWPTLPCVQWWPRSTNLCQKFASPQKKLTSQNIKILAQFQKTLQFDCKYILNTTGYPNQKRCFQVQ